MRGGTFVICRCRLSLDEVLHLFENFPRITIQERHTVHTHGTKSVSRSSSIGRVKEERGPSRAARKKRESGKCTGCGSSRSVHTRRGPLVEAAVGLRRKGAG